MVSYRKCLILSPFSKFLAYGGPACRTLSAKTEKVPGKLGWVANLYSGQGCLTVFIWPSCSNRLVSWSIFLIWWWFWHLTYVLLSILLLVHVDILSIPWFLKCLHLFPYDLFLTLLYDCNYNSHGLVLDLVIMNNFTTLRMSISNTPSPTNNHSFQLAASCLTTGDLLIHSQPPFLVSPPTPSSYPHFLVVQVRLHCPITWKHPQLPCLPLGLLKGGRPTLVHPKYLQKGNIA